LHEQQTISKQRICFTKIAGETLEILRISLAVELRHLVFGLDRLKVGGKNDRIDRRADGTSKL